MISSYSSPTELNPNGLRGFCHDYQTPPPLNDIRHAANGRAVQTQTFSEASAVIKRIFTIIKGHFVYLALLALQLSLQNSEENTDSHDSVGVL